MEDKETNKKFYSNNYYHIYNRGNNKEQIFFSPENYNYFLKKFDFYLSNYLDVFSYALLLNHFHFLIRVKPNKTSEELTSQFRKFFISYAKSINKQLNRTGSLFQKNFKRKNISNSNYLYRIILYIHANPQKHNIVTDYKQYRFSSYKSLVSDKTTKLKRDEVFELFGSRELFVKFHDENKYIYSNFRFN